MSEITGSNIPDLGKLGENSNGHIKKVSGFPPGILIRYLDADGAMEPESTRMQSVMTPNGPQISEQMVLGRKNIVTAEDLVEMMADKVYESLAIYFTHLNDRLDELENNLKAGRVSK